MSEDEEKNQKRNHMQGSAIVQKLKEEKQNPFHDRSKSIQPKAMNNFSRSLEDNEHLYSPPLKMKMPKPDGFD